MTETKKKKKWEKNSYKTVLSKIYQAHIHGNLIPIRQIKSV